MPISTSSELLSLKAVHYFSSGKNPQHGEAIIAGFGAQAVSMSGPLLGRGYLHLIGGMQFGSFEILQAVRASGEPYVFFDRAYFGGGPGTNLLRAVRNGYQKNWVDPRPGDNRLRRFGVTLQPWRGGGKHILLVPPSEPVARQFGLVEWEDHMIAALNAVTARRVWVSRLKRDPTPLNLRLRDCWCVVTYTSNVAVDAIVAGVPAICSPLAAAAPVAGALDKLEECVEAPPRPAREAWAASLAWGQFNLAEIAGGVARRVVLGDS